jgi:nitrite reductase/ring-hydroxylating ferredoxin subunit
MPRVRLAAADVPPGRARYVEAGGVGVAVFNAGGGRFHALGAGCPHEDGPLDEGWVEDGAAVCPWHGFDFDLVTGRCRAVEDLAVPVYPVRVDGDGVEVDVP